MENKKQDMTLTNRQGHPIADNQNIRTVGNRGPSTLENYHYFEKITHFTRERIPERVVHARGAGAHGIFEAMVKLVMSLLPNIHVPNCFRSRQKNSSVCTIFYRCAWCLLTRDPS